MELKNNSKSLDQISKQQDNLSVTQVLDTPSLTTDPDLGLNQSEVALRVERGDVNTPVESPLKTTKEIILSNIFTYFNMIFIIIAL